MHACESEVTNPRLYRLHALRLKECHGAWHVVCRCYKHESVLPDHILYELGLVLGIPGIIFKYDISRINTEFDSQSGHEFGIGVRGKYLSTG